MDGTGNLGPSNALSTAPKWPENNGIMTAEDLGIKGPTSHVQYYKMETNPIMDDSPWPSSEEPKKLFTEITTKVDANIEQYMPDLEPVAMASEPLSDNHSSDPVSLGDVSFNEEDEIDRIEREVRETHRRMSLEQEQQQQQRQDQFCRDQAADGAMLHINDRYNGVEDLKRTDNSDHSNGDSAEAMPDGDDETNKDEQEDKKQEEEELGRNRRVRQKNRYFLDFHCSNLAKGSRSKDEFDVYTAATGGATSTRSSNRRSNVTQSVRSSTDTQDKEDDAAPVFITKYCRSCHTRTAHDLETGCQACLYKKIVKSKRKAKPSRPRTSRSQQQRQQQQRSAPQELEQQASEHNNGDFNEEETSQTNTVSPSQEPSPDPASPAPTVPVPIVATPVEVASADSKSTDQTTAPDSESLPAVDITVKSLNNLTSNTNNTPNNNHHKHVEELNELKLTHLDKWTPDQVAQYVSSKGFETEASAFKSQAVDGVSLLLMQRTDFTHGLKMKLGPALKLYNQVCRLKDEYFSLIATV